MTTETVLIFPEIMREWEGTDNALSFARAIEQAVLQSPEVQALRRDSARYQWLRDGGDGDIGVVMGFDCIDAASTAVVGTYGEGLDGEHLDDAIDAAMEKQS